MSAKTPADRQRDRTERLARDGLKRVPVIVPVELEGDIKLIAQIMRQAKRPPKTTPTAVYES